MPETMRHHRRSKRRHHDPGATADSLHGHCFQDAAQILAFLQDCNQLLPGEGLIDSAATASPGQHGAHLIMTTHRLLVAKTAPDGAPRLVSLESPHTLDFQLTLHLRGQRVYEIQGFQANDIARIQQACTQLAPVTPLQRVLEVLQHMGIDPQRDPDCHLLEGAGVLEVLGRQFVFDPAGNPRPQLRDTHEF